MKIGLLEIIDDPRFRYLFGNFVIDLNETELALLGKQSPKTYEQAVMDWNRQKDRVIELSYNKEH